MERVSGEQCLNDVCSSRILPTLEDVLNRTAHFPFTVDSFIEFLSLNDQLRPLEFILEARRYRRSYYSVLQQLGGMEPPSQRQLWHLSLLWQRLLDNYLASGSQYEIQLSAQVRYALMEYSHLSMLPPPDIIGLALEQVYEMMHQWIFPQYLAYVHGSQSK
jgi:hypothetical protein